MAMDAVDDDRASRWQLRAPVSNFVRISSDRTDDHPLVGVEG
jgi:uncharacterized membrane protein